jgi:hypothetical protein
LLQFCAAFFGQGEGENISPNSPRGVVFFLQRRFSVVALVLQCVLHALWLVSVFCTKRGEQLLFLDICCSLVMSMTTSPFYLCRGNDIIHIGMMRAFAAKTTALIA